jgi:hypothetical protein
VHVRRGLACVLRLPLTLYLRACKRMDALGGPRRYNWAGRSEVEMAEKTSEKDSPKRMIPEEVKEHMRAARAEFRESIKGLLPPEFVEHRRRARKEMLLAWRSMIDAALEKLESKSE